jgi:hypothetical protein
MILSGSYDWASMLVGSFFGRHVGVCILVPWNEKSFSEKEGLKSVQVRLIHVHVEFTVITIYKSEISLYMLRLEQ